MKQVKSVQWDETFWLEFEKYEILSVCSVIVSVLIMLPTVFIGPQAAVAEGLAFLWLIDWSIEKEIKCQLSW